MLPALGKETFSREEGNEKAPTEHELNKFILISVFTNLQLTYASTCEEISCLRAQKAYAEEKC